MALSAEGRLERPGTGSTSVGGSRLASWATLIAALAPIPYSLQRLAWASGLAVGISESYLSDLLEPAWGAIYLVMLAVLSEGTGAYVHVFLHRELRQLPSWVPGVGGARVRPKLVVLPLLAPILILTYGNLVAVWLLVSGTGISTEGHASWSIAAQALVFWVWWAALIGATWSYRNRTRQWP